MLQLGYIRRFLKLETSSGIVLFVTALIALLLSNSPLAANYQTILQTTIYGNPLLFWINEGLMSIFFLLVGLELKREVLDGELSNWSQILLPGVSALGGMLMPAVIYFAINHAHPLSLRGWAIPVATDIAFSLGVLSLFGRRVPLGLKIFLTALAIIDDLGAILIIAIFHSDNLSLLSFFGVAVLIVILQLMNILNVRRLLPYLFVGFLLWLCVLKSGVHATLAGVILALMIPREAMGSFEDFLHPWVAFLIMPLFAFANVGIQIKGIVMADVLSPITLGIVIGLFVGKQLGIFGSAWILVKSGWAKLPKETSWMSLYGVSILCGIGFTMSLFLGTLAFEDDGAVYLMHVRLGVLLGSLLAGIFGAIVLSLSLRSHKRDVRKQNV